MTPTRLFFDGKIPAVAATEPHKLFSHLPPETDQLRWKRLSFEWFPNGEGNFSLECNVKAPTPPTDQPPPRPEVVHRVVAE